MKTSCFSDRKTLVLRTSVDRCLPAESVTVLLSVSHWR